MSFRFILGICILTGACTRPALAQNEFLDTVYFEQGGSSLNYATLFTLNKLVALAKANNVYHIHLKAYSDGPADIANNRRLAQRRAVAARDYLLAMDLDPERVTWEEYHSGSKGNANAKAGQRLEIQTCFGALATHNAWAEKQ